MSQIETRVMAQVRRIHTLRRLLSPTALKTYVVVLCSMGLLSLVSVVNVFANMPSITAPHELARFLFNAVSNTEQVVLMLLAGAGVAFAMLLRDLLGHNAERNSPRLA